MNKSIFCSLVLVLGLTYLWVSSNTLGECWHTTNFSCQIHEEDCPDDFGHYGELNDFCGVWKFLANETSYDAVTGTDEELPGSDDIDGHGSHDCGVQYACIVSHVFPDGFSLCAADYLNERDGIIEFHQQVGSYCPVE